MSSSALICTRGKTRMGHIRARVARPGTAAPAHRPLRPAEPPLRPAEPAISVPTGHQVAGGSVAARAAGYGIPALQVDGDDVLAVLESTRRAFAHARAGKGPVVIEAMTYRRGPHSSADDPGRYRSLEEERDGAGEDPLERFRQRLLADGTADEAFFAASLAAAKAEAEQVRAGLTALGSRPGAEMFDLVFQETTPPLQAQAARWREESEHV